MVLEEDIENIIVPVILDDIEDCDTGLEDFALNSSVEFDSHRVLGLGKTKICYFTLINKSQSFCGFCLVSLLLVLSIVASNNKIPTSSCFGDKFLTWQIYISTLICVLLGYHMDISALVESLSRFHFIGVCILLSWFIYPSFYLVLSTILFYRDPISSKGLQLIGFFSLVSSTPSTAALLMGISSLWRSHCSSLASHYSFPSFIYVNHDLLAVIVVQSVFQWVIFFILFGIFGLNSVFSVESLVCTYSLSTFATENLYLFVSCFLVPLFVGYAVKLMINLEMESVVDPTTTASFHWVAFDNLFHNESEDDHVVLKIFALSNKILDLILSVIIAGFTFCCHLRRRCYSSNSSMVLADINGIYNPLQITRDSILEKEEIEKDATLTYSPSTFLIQVSSIFLLLLAYVLIVLVSPRNTFLMLKYCYTILIVVVVVVVSLCVF